MADKEISLSEWLVAGPFDSPAPGGQEASFSVKDQLSFDNGDLFSGAPAAGGAYAYFGKKLAWQSRTAADQAFLIAPAQKSGTDAAPQSAFLCTYLTTDRYSEVKLTLTSAHLLSVFLDGKAVEKKTTSEDEKPGELNATLKLERGTHQLVVKTVHDPEKEPAWDVAGKLVAEKDFADANLAATTTPQWHMSIPLLLEGPQISGVSISADGKMATVNIRTSSPEPDKSEGWLELRETATGKLRQTLRGKMSPGNINWSPVGQVFSYTSRNNGATTLWLVDWQSGETRALIEDLKDMGGYAWSADGSFIVYSVTEKAEENKDGITRLSTPRERWPNFRDKSFLYRVDVASGLRQRLTAGEASTSLRSIHPNGYSLLYTTVRDDYQKRPYTITSVYNLNLRTLKSELLFEDGWVGSIDYSPDGQTLLISGSPRLFDGIGNTLGADKIPNDYDSQLYLYDLKTGKATAISRDFDPTINDAQWQKDGKAIIVNATDGQYNRLYRYQLAKKQYETIALPIDVLNSFDLSDGKTAVFWGSGVSTPNRAFVLDLASKKSSLLSFPQQSTFDKVTFGKVEDFNFVNSVGTTIEGRVYYPPGFDPNKRYPAIVYYYGGTVSTTRDFGGRYPKNLFASQGYVVYVPQPSGATGYGQAFSALHVNDWGQRAAADIIEGTQKFLAAHAFVDAEKVGCIGASYGGFMTMSLLTQTDIFATGIAHAGISSLSSYWGEGFWGYLYSSVATAESFPWNARDLYVEQSPLFNADKVQDPLLLLSGDSDTNVPRGESDQFYVALKLLGKEVEYVRVAGEDHHILTHNKRVAWQKTILAWFDRYLKDQGQWWKAMYPEK
ncbi:MAG: S9 family peptidase [Calditrichaeota bacterium]|nr:S9 family peptidase [Calditrichota bacterium]